MTYQKGDRVLVGEELYGTVEKVSSDGEVKVVLDGDEHGMYYPPSGVELLKEDS